MSLSWDPVYHLAGPSPGAAPEPAGGIQTPGTVDPLSPASACVAALTTSPPHCSSERALRPTGPSLHRWAPCRVRGLKLDQGLDDGIGPLKSGVLVGLVWELEGQALWFYLWSEKGQCKHFYIRAATKDYFHLFLKVRCSDTDYCHLTVIFSIIQLLIWSKKLLVLSDQQSKPPKYSVYYHRRVRKPENVHV